MPLYEYECSACKFYVEALQKISDPPIAKCPSCGKDTMQRLISAPVFRLKGAGWYETDFKSEQENKRNLADSADKEPAAAAQGDDKGDKKPIKVRASKAVKAAKKSVSQAPAKKRVTSLAKKTASKPKPKLKPKPKAKAPTKKKVAKPPRKAKQTKKKAAKKAARKK